MLTNGDLGSIKNVVGGELRGFATKDDLKKEIKPLKSDLSKIRKDVDVMLSMLDREYVDLRKRVERIEDHLQLAPLS